VLETVAFFRDTLIGKPSQNLQLSGGILHGHAWLPMELNLTDDEAKLLEK